MINFAVGPVQMDEEIRAIGAEEVPYFRTPEFSAIMKENERLMKQFTGAPEDALQNMPNLAGVNVKEGMARYMVQCRIVYFEKGDKR